MASKATKVHKVLSAAAQQSGSLSKHEAKLVRQKMVQDQVDGPGNFMAHRTAVCVYDFAVDGGAVATITPAGTATLPANAIVTSATIEVLTAVTSSGSATVAVQVVNAGDTLGATAKASLTLGAIVVGAAGAAPYKVAADSVIKVVVATAALTAGKLRVYVNYIYPNS